MRWFVAIDGRVFGPYSPEQLTAFLQPGTMVTREAEVAWRAASEEPLLADVLAGKLQPVLEWYVMKNEIVRGPYTQAALLAILDRHEMKGDDLLRHVSWETFVPFRETQFHYRMKNPRANIGEISAKKALRRPADIEMTTIRKAPQVSPAEDARQLSTSMVVAVLITVLTLIASSAFFFHP